MVEFSGEDDKLFSPSQRPETQTGYICTYRETCIVYTLIRSTEIPLIEIQDYELQSAALRLPSPTAQYTPIATKRGRPPKIL